MTQLLVLHGATPYSRATQLAHIAAFSNIAGADVIYHHLNAPVTPDFRAYPFDAVIINYDFLAARQSSWHQVYRERYAFLADMDCPRIALTMDDCFRSEILEDWLLSLAVDVVFSPLAEHSDKIYPRLSRKGIVRGALTGYVDVEILPQVQSISRTHAHRDIDVGSRVARPPPSHGRFALTKAQYAQRFAERAATIGVRCDISTTGSDSFVNLDWFRFLAACRCTIAMKGGYGLIDPRGEIRQRTDAFLQLQPEAQYDTIKAACFHDIDDTLAFTAVSPRLFEAAMTHTCQIMPRGDYPGGLEPWQHYVPLEVDLEDFNQAIEAIRSRHLCQEIAQRCYDVLIASGKYTHRTLTDEIMKFVPRRGPSTAARHLETYQNAIRSIESMTAKWHPLTKMTIGVAHLFASLNKTQKCFDLVINECNARWSVGRHFILPSDLRSETLAPISGCPAILGYLALANLFAGLGEGHILEDVSLHVLTHEAAQTAFLRFNFCGRNPPTKQFVASNELAQGRIEYALYADAERHYLSLALPSDVFIIHARTAALRIARGDSTGAIDLMQDVLASSHALQAFTSREQRAHDGLTAALIGYVIALRLQNSEDVVRRAVARVVDCNLRERFTSELQP